MSSENPYIKYLREDRLPHIFCPGCGNGIVLNTFFKGMEKAEIGLDDVSLVSGIGCSSRIPGYVKCDSLHTTHGRPISFATGLKLANPERNVIVFSGDGDSASIGGNHLIHAARKNIDLTVICINNNIYGMTGGQISPTSPKGSFGTTAPYGSFEKSFQLSELVAASGASYVARYTTAHALMLTFAIESALKTKGFSFIEVVAQCPTYYGRKNKIKQPTDMLIWLKDNSIFKMQADNMEPKEKEGKIIIGEITKQPHEEYSEEIYKLIEKQYGDKPNVFKSAYRG